jgi:hypothetical protein
MFGFLNLGHSDLFDIWDLEFYPLDTVLKNPYLLEQFIDCPFFEEIKPV